LKRASVSHPALRKAEPILCSFLRKTDSTAHQPLPKFFRPQRAAGYDSDEEEFKRMPSD